MVAGGRRRRARRRGRRPSGRGGAGRHDAAGRRCPPPPSATCSTPSAWRLYDEPPGRPAGAGAPPRAPPTARRSASPPGCSAAARASIPRPTMPAWRWVSPNSSATCRGRAARAARGAAGPSRRAPGRLAARPGHAGRDGGRVANSRAEARARLAALRDGEGTLGRGGPGLPGAALVEPRLAGSERAADPFTPLPEVPAWRRQWRLWRAAAEAALCSC